MSVSVHIHDGPLPSAAPWTINGAGAVLLFEGVVRPSEDGQPIEALDYEAYQPMAEQQLRALAQAMIDQFGVMAVVVEHSHDRVRAGECSFRLRIAAAHRKEALAAMDEFIDRMKRDVPIWKTPVPTASDTPRAAARDAGDTRS